MEGSHSQREKRKVPKKGPYCICMLSLEEYEKLMTHPCPPLKEPAINPSKRSKSPPPLAAIYNYGPPTTTLYPKSIVQQKSTTEIRQKRGRSHSQGEKRKVPKKGPYSMLYEDLITHPCVPLKEPAINPYLPSTTASNPPPPAVYGPPAGAATVSNHPPAVVYHYGPTTTNPYPYVPAAGAVYPYVPVAGAVFPYFPAAGPVYPYFPAVGAVYTYVPPAGAVYLSGPSANHATAAVCRNAPTGFIHEINRVSAQPTPACVLRTPYEHYKVPK